MSVHAGRVGDWTHFFAQHVGRMALDQFQGSNCQRYPTVSFLHPICGIQEPMNEVVTWEHSPHHNCLDIDHRGSEFVWKLLSYPISLVASHPQKYHVDGKTFRQPLFHLPEIWSMMQQLSRRSCPIPSGSVQAQFKRVEQKTKELMHKKWPGKPRDRAEVEGPSSKVPVTIWIDVSKLLIWAFGCQGFDRFGMFWPTRPSVIVAVSFCPGPWTPPVRWGLLVGVNQWYYHEEDGIYPLLN